MYEIELKAWMDDRAAVEAALREFAVYEDTLDKRDTYWHLYDTPAADGTHMTVRLRSETRESTGVTETFVTYKHKNRITGTSLPAADVSASQPQTLPAAGATNSQPQANPAADAPASQPQMAHDATFEVNEEHEFTVSDADAFGLILKDAGFVNDFTKHKTAGSWHFGDFHIELCELEGLGQFIEIETFAGENTPDAVQTAHTELLEVLTRCGVSPDRIEGRYYSELYQSLKE